VGIGILSLSDCLEFTNDRICQDWLKSKRAEDSNASNWHKLGESLRSFLPFTADSPPPPTIAPHSYTRLALQGHDAKVGGPSSLAEHAHSEVTPSGSCICQSYSHPGSKCTGVASPDTDVCTGCVSSSACFEMCQAADI
jgi:hypothetical protein